MMWIKMILQKYRNQMNLLFIPNCFYIPNENTTITIGNSFTKGERTGGDIQVIKNKADASHQYFEKNKTIRNISTFEFDKKIGDKKRLVAKQSFSVFDRHINIPAYTFCRDRLQCFYRYFLYHQCEQTCVGTGWKFYLQQVQRKR